MVPEGVTVLSAFHTVSAALLTDLEHELDEDVLICGDRRADKDKLVELVEKIDGLRAVNAGPLEMARIVETAHPAADLDQRAQQGAGRHPHHRPEPVSAGSVVVLAGGTGGAKLARGMLDVVGPGELTVIANTGDDIEIYGAHVSPDPDLISFWLADRIDSRGWGLGRRHVPRHGRTARARRRTYGSTSVTVTWPSASTVRDGSMTASG